MDRSHGAVTLSKKDLIRFKVIEAFRAGEYSREQAALKLELSERQVTRLAKRVREHGIEGIIHGNKGKPPVNKIPDEVVNRYVDLYETKYQRFNYQHGLEMMKMHEELPPLSYSRFHKACRVKGIGKTRKRRPSKARIARERHANEGFMWQLDGSPEKWNLKNKMCLVAIIDDATSDVPEASLEPSETTWACMNVVRKAIEKKGIPEFILTDRAGWAESKGKRAGFTQFDRACKELGITLIATASAQSKGRIERMNRTFQDRLIPELDLYGITGRTDCNRYLKQVFLPTWREKFTVAPRSATTRYKKLPADQDLREIFCLKSDRIVNSAHQVNYKGKIYLVDPGLQGSLKGRRVTIHEYEDKTISILYGGAAVEFKQFVPPKRKWVRRVG